MKSFKDFNIKSVAQGLQGDKLNINRIINREIVVEDFRIDDSKHKIGEKYLSMQFLLGDNRHVVFTGSKVLMETIKQIPRGDFPFKTTIVKDDKRLDFS